MAPSSREAWACKAVGGVGELALPRADEPLADGVTRDVARADASAAGGGEERQALEVLDLEHDDEGADGHAVLLGAGGPDGTERAHLCGGLRCRVCACRKASPTIGDRGSIPLPWLGQVPARLRADAGVKVELAVVSSTCQHCRQRVLQLHSSEPGGDVATPRVAIERTSWIHG